MRKSSREQPQNFTSRFRSEKWQKANFRNPRPPKKKKTIICARSEKTTATRSGGNLEASGRGNSVRNDVSSSAIWRFVVWGRP